MGSACRSSSCLALELLSILGCFLDHLPKSLPSAAHSQIAVPRMSLNNAASFVFYAASCYLIPINLIYAPPAIWPHVIWWTPLDMERWAIIHCARVVILLLSHVLCPLFEQLHYSTLNCVCQVARFALRFPFFTWLFRLGALRGFCARALACRPFLRPCGLPTGLSPWLAWGWSPSGLTCSLSATTPSCTLASPCPLCCAWALISPSGMSSE